MTNQDTAITTANGANFVVLTSSDGGLNWSGPTVIAPGESLPGLLRLTDTTFLAVWDSTEGASGGSLVSQRFTVS